MDYLDAPNTRSGYCPICSQLAIIWNVTKNVWECSYCNWDGAMPDKEPKLKTIYGADSNAIL